MSVPAGDAEPEGGANRYRWPLVAACVVLAVDAFIVQRLVAWHGVPPRPTFLEYAVGHGVDEYMALLGLAAIVFLLVLASALWIVRRRVGVETAKAALAAIAVSLNVAVVAIATFEGAASWYRHEPHGSSAERGAASLESFLDRARVAFFSLYVVLLLVAAACGWAFGHAIAGRGAAVALATLVAVAAYFTLTLPYVDYENSCNAGRAFVFQTDCG